MTETGGQPLPRSTRIIYAAFDNAAQHTDRILNLVLLAVVLAILGSGFHIVKKEEAGVVVRFGKVIEEHGEPGIHYHVPIIDRVHVRAVKRIATHQIAHSAINGVNFTSPLWATRICSRSALLHTDPQPQGLPV